MSFSENDKALLRQIRDLGESQLRDVLNYLVLLNAEAVQNALLYVLRSGRSSKDGHSSAAQRVFASDARTLVVLCSYTPKTKKQIKHQDRAMELCKSRSIRPQIILGTNPDEVERCHHLYQVSGIRDKYPQFFIKEPNGTVQFLGDMRKIEDMINQGIFTKEHLRVEDPSKNKKSTPNSVPDHLIDVNQPKNTLSDDDASFPSSDMFDPPVGHNTSLVDAAKRAKMQIEQQNRRERELGVPEYLLNLNQPQVPTDDEDKSLKVADVFEAPQENLSLLGAARKAKQAMEQQQQAERPKPEPAPSPKPPPPTSHKTPDSWDNRKVAPEGSAQNGQQPRADGGVPMWVQNVSGSHQQPDRYTHPAGAGGPSWMDNAQQQQVQQPPPPPPPPPSSGIYPEPTLGFHNSVDSGDLDVITETDDDESPQQERRKSITDKFPTGGACYLVYHPVEGELNIHYSEVPIDGAVGVWTSPDILMFKEAQGLGSSELIGNCATQVHDRKNYYSGWCQFVKAGHSMEATITVLDVGLPVDFYAYKDGSSYKCEGMFEIADLDAVACVPKYHDFNTSLEGKKWSKEAKKVGAVAQFRPLTSLPKDSPLAAPPATEMSSSLPDQEHIGYAYVDPAMANASAPHRPPQMDGIESNAYSMQPDEPVSRAVHGQPLDTYGEFGHNPATAIAQQPPPISQPHQPPAYQHWEQPPPPQQMQPPTQQWQPPPQPHQVMQPPPQQLQHQQPPQQLQQHTLAPQSPLPSTATPHQVEQLWVDHTEGACYLTYEPDSSGRLVIHYSKTPIENAIGMWVPGGGKKISGFKFKQNLGKAVLIGSCASGVQGRKNYCSGWCQFVREAKILNGWVTLWDPVSKGLKVDVWLYRDDKRASHQSVKLEQGVPTSTDKLLAVAALPKYTEFYNGMAVDILKWLADAGNIGSSSRMQ